MVCIYCDSKTKVSNSRSSGKGTWRRRECLSCEAIFTTREQIELEGVIRVRKADGSLQPFSRDKLFVSVNQSLSHRKSALEDATELTDTITKKSIALQKGGVLNLNVLTDVAHSILQLFDQPAAVHYQAHHLQQTR